MNFPSLKNHFLVAMPSMTDPYFEHSVALLCEHNEEGAMGIVVNRPIDLKLSTLFRQLEIVSHVDDLDSRSVLAGGPVQQERGFVIHPPMGSWDSSLTMSDEIAITTSKDVLQAIAQGSLPPSAFVALGYAGWSEGQLEDELAKNCWLTVPVDPQILFDTPVAQRWHKAIASLGIDASQLSSDAGHA